MFSYEYESYNYFFDLVAFTIVLLPCYYLSRSELIRRLLMIFSGMYLLWFIAPRLALFYLGFWALVFLVQRAIALADRKKGLHLATFVAATAVVLLPMVFWKIMGPSFNYRFNITMNGILPLFSPKLWEIDIARSIITPLGLSFATFRSVDLLIKTYLGSITALGFDRIFFYGFFPPAQLVGPIIEYEEVDRQDARPDPKNILHGFFRIGVGAIKIFFIAEPAKAAAEIFASPQDFPVWMLWIQLVVYFWYFYLNFSGYSDIAIGTAKLFGFNLKENFNFPLFQRNIQGFWKNWHMGLSRWAQRNIFVPFGGYRAKTRDIALFLTMMTIALWHDISLSMVVFGIYHFCGLEIHRLYASAREKRGIPAGSQSLAGLHVLGTFFFVMMSLPLLATDLGKAVQFYLALAGL